MSNNYNQQLFKKTSFRSRKGKLTRKHTKNSLLSIQHSSLITQYHQVLVDLQKPGTRFSSYTIIELEPICQQLAIQQMSTSPSSVTTCPWICLFCENFIYEPLTFYCGHTYCEQCIIDDEYSSFLINCPRCPKDVQGQIPSSVGYAREKHFQKNHFLKQLLDRTESLKLKRENILLCHQAQQQYTNRNYQEAIDIYSSILEKCKTNLFSNFQHLSSFLFEDDDEHIAFYGRARSYLGLQELDKALEDIDRVILLKPHWAKVQR
jgi:tetratricopeptide (TPR) repeat protein